MTDEPPILDDDASYLSETQEDLADEHEQSIARGRHIPHVARSVKSYRMMRLMKANGEPSKMDDAAKDRACQKYAETGVKYLAAAAAGVTPETMRQHENTDEVFKEALENARLEFCASLEVEAHRRAFLGTVDPIIGRVGKDEDGVITYVRRYSDKLAETLLKRHMPNDYVERMHVDANVSGGVLVVGAPMTMDVWNAKHSGRQPRHIVPLLEDIRGQLTDKGESLK